MPPPNVTGVLTIGHVLNNTLQDILIRRARIEGNSALWIPGLDHAGIATQTVVEREMRKQKKTRHDFGREKFVERVWEWRREKGGKILEQLQRLGASCDWDRTQFTMDPAYSAAVLRTFTELFQRGHIYRGKRMVNWCPVSLTALSDEEVIMKPANATLFKVRYELTDAPGEYIHVATTRPETIPGDVAIAVHPEDPRYAAMVGRKVWRPLNRAQIAIVSDPAVDPKFGSGALKITPAHDKVDYEIGQRHHLPILDILNADATLNELAGPELAGMDRFAARKKAAELLRASGALIGEEAYQNNVGYSERADVPDRTPPHMAVVAALSKGRGGQVGCSRRPHPLPSRALVQGLPPLAREHPGLVHQPAALVGSPDTGLVPQGPGPRPADRGRPEGPRQGPRLHAGAARSRELGPGGRRPRHVGLVVAVAVRHPGLARAGQDGGRGLRAVLPHEHARHGP